MFRGLSECLSVVLTTVSPATTAEPIEMPFVVWTHAGPRNHVHILDWAVIAQDSPETLNFRGDNSVLELARSSLIVIGTARIVCVRLSVCLSQNGLIAANPLLWVCCCELGWHQLIAAWPAFSSSGVRRMNAVSATLSAYAGS